jgi:hypothetical protein
VTSEGANDSVIGLGYLGLEVNKPEDWLLSLLACLEWRRVRQPRMGQSHFATMTTRKRIRLHRSKADDIAYLGFEVADQAALGEVTRHLEAAGTMVRAAALRSLTTARGSRCSRSSKIQTVFASSSSVGPSVNQPHSNRLSCLLALSLVTRAWPCAAVRR